jgi:Restriction endonuclease fold toxin 9
VKERWIPECGIRPDAINFRTKEIIELKPDNGKRRREGLRQLARDIARLTAEFGPGWSGRVVTYP